jgi:hypothetical protein
VKRRHAPAADPGTRRRGLALRRRAHSGPQAAPASAQDGVLLYSNVDFPTFCLGVGDNGGPNLDAGIQ